MNEHISRNTQSLESKETTRRIEYAQLSDSEGVLSVQNENLLSSLEGEKVADRGFLVNPITLQELEEIIAAPERHIFLVSRKGESTEGYVLAYDIDEWKRKKPKWEQSIKLGKQSDEVFLREKSLYLRHIAVRQKSRGVGFQLEKKLFREASTRGYQYLFGEILKSPISNTVSLEFHKKIGFRVIGNTMENERLWDVVMKDLQK